MLIERRRPSGWISRSPSNERTSFFSPETRGRTRDSSATRLHATRSSHTRTSSARNGHPNASAHVNAHPRHLFCVPGARPAASDPATRPPVSSMHSRAMSRAGGCGRRSILLLALCSRAPIWGLNFEPRFRLILCQRAHFENAHFSLGRLIDAAGPHPSAAEPELRAPSQVSGGARTPPNEITRRPANEMAYRARARVASRHSDTGRVYLSPVVSLELRVRDVRGIFICSYRAPLYIYIYGRQLHCSTRVQLGARIDRSRARRPPDKRANHIARLDLHNNNTFGYRF